MSSAAFRYAVLAAGLPAVLSGSTVHADDSASFAIRDWQAPTAIARPCRDAAHFTALTQERVGASAVREATLSVQIRIDRIEGGLRLQMTTRAGGEEEGERELFAPSCETLLQTAALVLSLALLPDYFQNERDHSVVTVRSASAASGSRTGEQANDSEVPSIPEPDMERRAAFGLGNQPLDVGVNMAVLADIGTLPQPAVGLALVFHAESASYQLAFRLSRWAEQQAFVTDAREPGNGARFDYLAGTLQLCKTVWKSGGVCGQASAGRLSAEPIDIDLPIERANLIASAGGAVFVESRAVSWARFRVQAELSAHLLLPRYSVGVRPPDELNIVEREIHQPSVVYGLISASWGLAF